MAGVMGALKTGSAGMAVVVLAIGTLPFEVAWSADAATTVAIDVDPQPLETALVELCKQGHLQLVIATGYLPVKVAAPLHGKIPLGVALDTLLRDTGLTYKFVGGHTVAIVKPAADDSRPSEPNTTQRAPADEGGSLAPAVKPESADADRRVSGPVSRFQSGFGAQGG